MTIRICCSPDSPTEEYPDKPSEEELEKLVEEGFGNRPFEGELAEDFMQGDLDSTSLRTNWIRKHLSDVGGDTPKRMWERFVAFIEAQDLDPDFESYSDFGNYLYRLLELNLIKTIEGESDNKNDSELEKVLLKTVGKNFDWDMAWENPLKMIYPHSWKSWVERKLSEGLTPSEIAQRAEEITPRSIEVEESKVLQNMKEWGLE